MFSVVSSVFALDLDWKGQFRGENVWVPNYTAGSIDARDPAREQGEGYYVGPAGQKGAKFQTLFLRLNPTVIVNDNVRIFSEIWFGNPQSGFFGNNFPGGNGQNYFNSTYSGGSSITAQRFWGDFYGDFGTLQFGRAPLHWGLGAFYNDGNQAFDRFQSTADVIRLNSKFGNFSLIPEVAKYSLGGSQGNSLVGGLAGGASATVPSVVGGVGMPLGATTANTGSAGFADYSLALRYENTDEQFDGGVKFIRRLAGAQSNVQWVNGSSGGMGMTIWDVYLKKSVSKFDFAIEAPIMGGNLVGATYRSYAVVGEIKYHANPNWLLFANAGKVPGQPGDTSAARDNAETDGNSSVNPSRWNMMYLHPNYRLGLIMFNYQLRAFGRTRNPYTTGSTVDDAGVNPVESIYDNPITNANYLVLGASYAADKWLFTGKYITASADETAQSGTHFFNSWDRKYSTSTYSGENQSSSLGSEIDFSTDFKWDEYTSFGLDLGYYMTGKYYAFSGTGTPNETKGILAAVGRVSVVF